MIERSIRSGPLHPFARLHVAMHYTHSPVTVDTNTLVDDVQTTSDCQSDEPNNQSAHSRLRSGFGDFADRSVVAPPSVVRLVGLVRSGVARGGPVSG